MIAACDWNAPGADRYTGTVAAAVASYGLPIATQNALIEAFERRHFVDSVVIDRDSIRGQHHDYDPEIRGMHFGSRGRTCGTVTRAGWRPDHVETALVVCAGGECIAWPAVCGNVFRLTRRDRPVQPPVAAARGEPLMAFDPPSAGLVGAPVAEVTPEFAALAAAYYGPRGGLFVEPPLFFNYPIALAVPEPTTWALLAGGLVLLALRRIRK